MTNRTSSPLLFSYGWQCRKATVAVRNYAWRFHYAVAKEEGQAQGSPHDRAFGGDCNHRDPDRLAPARCSKGAGGGQQNAVPKQSETNRPCWPERGPPAVRMDRPPWPVSIRPGGVALDHRGNLWVVDYLEQSRSRRERSDTVRGTLPRTARTLSRGASKQKSAPGYRGDSRALRGGKPRGVADQKGTVVRKARRELEQTPETGSLNGPGFDFHGP